MNTPTGYTELDMIGYTDRGDYSSAATYVKNDLVHYLGSIWRCKIDGTTGVTPRENANWTIFISAPTSSIGETIAPIEASPSEAPYDVGDQLIHNDILYKVIDHIDIGDDLTVNNNIVVARKIAYQVSDVESDIATIEQLSTASRAYAVGEYMFYDWKFYKVKTAIAQEDTIVTSGASANVEETQLGGEVTRLNNAVSNILNAVYPVGSIYMSVVNTNPGSLFGGTWVAWGSGKVPVGVDANDQDFDTVEETGGTKSENYTPAGSNSGGSVTSHSYTPAGTVGGTTLTAAQSGIPAHSHGLGSHVHSVGAHSHGLNSHTHSVGAHSHGLNNHTHGMGHVHSMAHTHTINGHYHTYQLGAHGYYGALVGADSNLIFGRDYAGGGSYELWTNMDHWMLENTDVNNGLQTSLSNITAEARKLTATVSNSGTLTSNGSSAANTGAPTASGTYNTGAASGSTANSTAFNTGAASGSTANSTAFNTGAASGSTDNNTAGNASKAHDHSFTGTAATLSHTVTQPTFSGTQAIISHLQPYITCYMWKRTA